MSANYRAQLDWCLTCGERIPFSFEEHSRQAVLEKLEGCLETGAKGYEELYVREEDEAIEDMLWILTIGEEMEKGFYHNNQPPMDVAIVAPPALMAVLMGKYEWAMLLCQYSNVTSWKNRVDEVYISKGRACSGNGYSFGEVCLLCEDMSAGQLQFFAKKGYFEPSQLLGENAYLYWDCVLWTGPEKDEWDLELLWKSIYSVKKLSSMSVNIRELLALVFEAVFNKKLDTKCPQFWERLFELFTQKEERVVMMEVVHNYFYSSFNYIFSERMQKAMVAYFQQEEGLPMVGAIEKYIVRRVIAEFHKGAYFQDRLRTYFGIVKTFEGAVDGEWKEGMLELLKLNQEGLLALGFQSGFLKKECMEEYVSLLSKEKGTRSGSNVPIIARLIQMRWRAEQL